MEKFKDRASGKFVTPGDALAVIEEFFPDKGTYTEDGNIYSVITGRMLIDKIGRKISVISNVKNPLLPNIGSIVIGQVNSLQSKSLSLKIYQIDGKVPTEWLTGILHVSDVSNNYIKSMHDAFKTGDVVRAKVISKANNEVHLSTREEQMGVISALCSYCGHELILQKGLVRCPVCNKSEKRKVASEYSNFRNIKKL